MVEERGRGKGRRWKRRQPKEGNARDKVEDSGKGEEVAKWAVHHRRASFCNRSTLRFL